MVSIPFPVTTAPGEAGQESGGQLINCYASRVEGAPPSPVLFERSAGMREFSRNDNAAGFAEEHINCRGMIQVGSTIIAVFNESCYAISTTGIATYLGPLPGTAPVIIAKNGKSPVPDVFAVTGTAGWLLFTDAAPQSYDGGGALASPNSVAVVNNYAVFSTAGGLVQATEINSTNIPTNSNVIVPMEGLRRVVEHNNRLLVMAKNKFRIYRDVGASPFPFEYLQGSERDIGIASTTAVAGIEAGWPDAMIFASSDSRVYRMQGYEPVQVSSEDVDRVLGRIADKSAIQAATYIANGQAFWVLIQPDGCTLEYNLKTGNWNERCSYNRMDWKGRVIIKAFDKWICGESGTGRLYELMDDWPLEGPDPHIWTLVSGSVTRYPNWLDIPNTYFRFTSGPGLDRGLIPIQSDPIVRVSWSKDGGETYGYPVERKLGVEGRYKTEVSIGNISSSSRKGIRYKLQISDGIRIGFMGADHELIELAA